MDKTSPIKSKPLVDVTCKLGTKGCFEDGRCHAIGNCENKIVTNADRIRAMSDEELVVFLDGFSSRCLCCVGDANNQSCPIYKEGHYCRPQDIMEWLQKPVEGE